MTLRYVRSSATGSANGTNWANAYLNTVTALAACSAGDTVYVAEDSAESNSAGFTLASPGTAANPVNVVCVDHNGSVPPVSADLRTTATISCPSTGNSIQFTGGTVYTGIIFNQGTSTGNAGMFLGQANSSFLRFVNCALKLIGTGASGLFAIGNGNQNIYVDLYNTPMTFANVGQKIVITGARLRWRNTASAIAGSVPTVLFDWTSAAFTGHVDCVGVDLSAAGSGKTLVNNTASEHCTARFSDCKLGASVTRAAAPAQPTSFAAEFYRCSSSGVNYSYGKNDWGATLDDDESVVRTGGASNGTTTISWKIITTANTNWQLPFESQPMDIWNDTSGSAITVTVYGIWGGGAVPNNDDIWIEAEYLGSSSSPLASFVNSSKADVLAASAPCSSDTSTWSGSTTPFKMAVTFTPQQKGDVIIRVKAAKPSSTFYVDPKPVIAGVTVSKSHGVIGSFVNELASGGMLFVPSLEGT